MWRPYRSNGDKEFTMKKLALMAVALVLSGSAAYAAAPEAVHGLAKACGLPCC